MEAIARPQALNHNALESGIAGIFIVENDRDAGSAYRILYSGSLSCGRKIYDRGGEIPVSEYLHRLNIYIGGNSTRPITQSISLRIVADILEPYLYICSGIGTTWVKLGNRGKGAGQQLMFTIVQSADILSIARCIRHKVVEHPLIPVHSLTTDPDCRGDTSHITRVDCAVNNSCRLAPVVEGLDLTGDDHIIGNEWIGAVSWLLEDTEGILPRWDTREVGIDQ